MRIENGMRGPTQHLPNNSDDRGAIEAAVEVGYSVEDGQPVVDIITEPTRAEVVVRVNGVSHIASTIYGDLSFDNADAI